MTILKQLDDLRTAFPPCVAVGLVDVGSGIVLCVSTQQKQPQEQLDAICAAGIELFNSPASQAFAKAHGPDTDKSPQEVIVLNTNDTCLFLRSPVDAMEAMFCLYEAEIDIQATMETARTAFNRIATE